MSKIKSKPANLPTAARQVLSAVRDSGWAYHTAWSKDPGGFTYLRVNVGRRASGKAPYVHAVVTWHLDPDSGMLRLSNQYVRQAPDGPWSDLPSVKALAEIVKANPVKV